MKKQINEASVRIDVQGLESNDLETLSRMLSLAGQAENKGPQLGGMTSIPAMAPLNFDTVGDEETQPIMSPELAPSTDELSPTGDSELGLAVDDLSGSITDFGEDSLDTEMSDDVESVGIETNFDDDYTGDDDFDMNIMSSLAGIKESRKDLDEENDESVSESLLPDLSLDEDSIATEADSSSHQEFGPFRTEFECVQDGQSKTNGFEGDHFIVVPKGNAFYWKRTMQEEVQNEPNPEFYDDDGIRNSKHAYKGVQPGTPLGDNPFIRESDEEEDEESVDAILESINQKYKKFMEEL